MTTTLSERAESAIHWLLDDERIEYAGCTNAAKDIAAELDRLRAELAIARPPLPVRMAECGVYCATAKALIDEADRLRAENARLVADAGRYRWLRGFDVDSYLACGKGAALDAAIDAAMAGDD